MMPRLLLFLMVLALAVLGGAALLPERVTVERSVTINRPAATVFTLLDGFVEWSSWSPWALRDPGLQFSRSGSDTGAGARIDWIGDPARGGIGGQEIVVSEPYRRIVIESDVTGQGPATLEYLVEGDRLGSRVSWGFETSVDTGAGRLERLVNRYFGWFLGRWVARDFELGLSELRRIAEQLPAADFAGSDIRRLQVASVPLAQVGGIVDAPGADVEGELAEAFLRIGRWAGASNVPLGDAPLVLTRRRADGPDELVAALPLDGAASPESAPPSPVALGRSPAGDAVCMRQPRAGDGVAAGSDRLDAWLAAHGLRRGNVAWERFLSDPRGRAADTPPGLSGTEICVLIADA